MRLGAPLEQLKEKAVDFLFPPHCLGCGKEGEFLCPSCSRSLPRLLPPLCAKCGRPLSLEHRCNSCQKWQLVIDGITSPFRFEGLIRRAIHDLKYNNFKALARPLARLLAEYLRARSVPRDILVPVALHRRRLRERGYNQSSLVARELGELISMPVLEGQLLRLRDTPAQARATNADVRRGNVAGAFACRDGRLEGKKVLVIDDVCTTGATLDSCAAALKKAGAASVWGLTVAREV